MSEDQGLNGGERLYYLETNSIRSLPKDKIRLCKLNIFTSHLCILEIISGINADNYQTYRNALIKIKESNIRINWTSNTRLMLASFGIECKDAGEGALRRTYEMILDVNDYERAKNISTYRKKYYDFSFITSLDSRVSIPGIPKEKAYNERIRSKLKKEDIDQIRESFNKDESEKTPDDVQSISRVIEGCYYLCMMDNITSIQKEENMRVQFPSNEVMLRQYNHKLDVFFFMGAYRMLNSLINGQPSAVNDIYDLNHLMYLVTKDSAIVTNDTKINRDMKKLYPNQIVTNDEFCKLL